MKSSQLCPGPKNYVVVSSRTVIHAIRRDVQYWWTKLNTLISAVLIVDLFSSVRKSYTYKLQQVQFGAANCRLLAALYFYLLRGLTVMYC